MEKDENANVRSKKIKSSTFKDKLLITMESNKSPNINPTTLLYAFRIVNAYYKSDSISILLPQYSKPFYSFPISHSIIRSIGTSFSTSIQNNHSCIKTYSLASMQLLLYEYIHNLYYLSQGKILSTIPFKNFYNQNNKILNRQTTVIEPFEKSNYSVPRSYVIKKYNKTIIISFILDKSVSNKNQVNNSDSLVTISISKGMNSKNHKMLPITQSNTTTTNNSNNFDIKRISEDVTNKILTRIPQSNNANRQNMLASIRNINKDTKLQKISIIGSDAGSNTTLLPNTTTTITTTNTMIPSISSSSHSSIFSPDMLKQAKHTLRRRSKSEQRIVSTNKFSTSSQSTVPTIGNPFTQFLSSPINNYTNKDRNFLSPIQTKLLQSTKNSTTTTNDILSSALTNRRNKLTSPSLIIDNNHYTTIPKLGKSSVKKYKPRDSIFPDSDNEDDENIDSISTTKDNITSHIETIQESSPVSVVSSSVLSPLPITNNNIYQDVDISNSTELTSNNHHNTSSAILSPVSTNTSLLLSPYITSRPSHSNKKKLVMKQFSKYNNHNIDDIHEEIEDDVELENTPNLQHNKTDYSSKTMSEKPVLSTSSIPMINTDSLSNVLLKKQKQFQQNIHSL